MKTVFRSKEIAHVWANEAAPYGNSPASTRFDGDRFYSFATVIANRIRHRGKVAYVVDSSTFSSFTSKHQGRVLQAIRNTSRVFHVHCGKRGQQLEFTPQSLRDYYMNEFKQMMDLPKSRYKFKQAEALIHAASRLKSASEVCAYFGIGGCHKIERMLLKLDDDLESAHKLVAERIQSRNAARIEAERIAKEKAEKEDAEKIPKWLAGENVILSYRCGPLMRVEGDEVVTSRGARVPIEHCKRSLLFCFSMREKGWHRNGHSHHVGHYQIEDISQEEVVVGCHHFKWPELERFGKQMGWV